MSRQATTYLTPQEYLTLERQDEYKNEYFNGEMIPMTGASRKHNLIVTNLLRELSQQLKEESCEVYPSDMRVRVPATGLYVYPDIVVVCGEPKLEDAFFDTLLNPTLLIEVLSESTAAHDRGKKFSDYRTAESLAEYLLIAQDECRVEQYIKQAADSWLLSDIRSLEDKIEFASVPCVLPLSEVYHKVDLPARRP
jgi:Uma2 family endonuclease